MSKSEIKSPYELFIIRRLTLVHDAMCHNDYYTATITLMDCMRSLPPSIKEKFSDPQNELRYILEKRGELKGSNLVYTRMKQHRFDRTIIYPYIDSLISEIWTALFTEGYIIKPQYGIDIQGLDLSKAEEY